MPSTLRSLLLCVATLAVFPAAWAFQPPLTDVQTSLITNGASVTVRYQVSDPVLGSVRSRDHVYPGNVSTFWVVTSLTVSSGMVAWVANAAGPLAFPDREIVFAVYDPARQAWQEQTQHYDGASINQWTLTAPGVTNGVVMWQANGSGLAYARDTEIGFSTYDPVTGAWRTLTHRYNGTDSSYWVIANRLTAGGLVMWNRINAGQFALRNQEVLFAIFDPTTSAWMEGSQYYEGHLNSAWVVVNPRIASQLLTWTATNRTESRSETRGYSQPQHRWTLDPTTATAAFATSATTGSAPFSVWFTDLSIGATNWSWSFGDGTNVTTRSPRHVFQQPGAFVVTQTVQGPSGLSAASVLVAAYPAPGSLAFDKVKVTITNGLLRLPVLGASGLSPVILYASTNLVDWVAIATNPPQAGPIELTDPLAPNRPGRFYRTMEPR